MQVTISIASKSSSHEPLQIRRTLSKDGSELLLMKPGTTEWSAISQVC